jgi:hypothetical protein
MSASDEVCMFLFAPDPGWNTKPNNVPILSLTDPSGDGCMDNSPERVQLPLAFTEAPMDCLVTLIGLLSPHSTDSLIFIG